MKELAKSLDNNQCITNVNLSGNGVGDEGAKHIAEALKRNKTITSIDLRFNGIGDVGIKELAKSLENNQYITNINLSENQAGDEGVKHIAEALTRNKTISTIDLSSNEIGVVGIKELAKSLENNQNITNINLSWNGACNEGAKHIAEALTRNKTITSIDLGFNELGVVGMKEVAKSLENNQYITNINLSNNQAGDEGAKHIAEALTRNKTITSIDLSGNRIGEVGIKELAKAFENNQYITNVNLIRNEAGDAGAKCLVEALKMNKLINTIDITFNRIGSVRMRELEKALEMNRMLALNKSKENVLNSVDIKIFEGIDDEHQFGKTHQDTIKSILYLIRNYNYRFQDRSKKGILLLGDTGAGKSTVAHVLIGTTLQAVRDNDTDELVIDTLQPQEDVIISHRASETRIPNKCTLKNLTIWDCPGVCDTDHVQEIVNTFYIKRIIEITDELKFVLLVPELVLNSAIGRGSIFITTLSIFLKNFTNVKLLMGSISLVVTHVPQTKTIHHIKKYINKAVTCHPNATEECGLIGKLKEEESIHLFYKPSKEGELTVPDLLATIDARSIYSSARGEVFNVALSKKALKFSNHLLKAAGNSFNTILEVIVKAICHANQCLNVNPQNVFSENHELLRDWVPSSMQYNDLLPKHDQDQYFSELNFQLKLQKAISDHQVSSISDAITIFQSAIDTFAEYAETGILRHKIQDYGYCLRQQYEHVEFFASICKIRLPDHTKIKELLIQCHAKLTENLENQVSSMSIDENQSDPTYFSKAIELLEKYPDSDVCRKLRAVAYICLAGITHDQELDIVYCKKALEIYSHLPKVYDRLGQLFFDKGEYAKAIDCYKVVNNEFNIKSCFEAWFKQSGKSPDIMLLQAEHLESMGLFEQAKESYHHAFCLSQDSDFKTASIERIGKIMVNANAQGEEFTTRAKEQRFYNFSLVNDAFIRKIFG